MSDQLSVMVTAWTSDPDHAARAAEVMGRACAGLLLEGISTSMTMAKVEVEDEEPG